MATRRRELRRHHTNYCAEYTWQTSFQSLGYGSIDAQKCANTSNLLKQVFSFRKKTKMTTPTKSKPSSFVLSCLAMFKDLLYGKVFASREVKVCITMTVVFFYFPWAFLLNRALHAITLSVLDIGAIYLWPWV